MAVINEDAGLLQAAGQAAKLSGAFHDARVLGDEPFVGIEFESVATYAKS